MRIKSSKKLVGKTIEKVDDILQCVKFTDGSWCHIDIGFNGDFILDCQDIEEYCKNELLLFIGDITKKEFNKLEEERVKALVREKEEQEKKELLRLKQKYGKVKETE